MKFSHNNISKIAEYLDKTGKVPTIDAETIYDVYDNVIAVAPKQIVTLSRKKRHDAVLYQMESIKKDLLKISYMKNNLSATGIRAGYVYAIVNPAWPEYCKIGSAIDVFDRLASYQTSSPLRDYSLLCYFFSNERIKDERDIQSMFPVRNNEWCKVDNFAKVKTIFKERQKRNRVPVLSKYLDVVGP